MRGRGILLIIALSMLFAQPVLAGEKKSKKKAIATKIVTQIADVKEKEIVFITGDVRDIDLLEELMLETHKAGAQPLQLVKREKFAKKYFKEVPEKHDTAGVDLATKLAGMMHVEIIVQGQENPGQLKKIDAKRLMAVNNAFMPIDELKQKRNVRRVYLGNALYPTKATAKQLGVSKKKLEKIFWSGLNVDYAILQERGGKLKTTLTAGKEVHVTNPNGTDVKFKIEGQPVTVSDGVISAEDVKKGGAATQVWLPAGEVFVPVVAGTAEGKVVIDRLSYFDGEIRNLAVTFKAGKVDQMTAKQNNTYKRFMEMYQAAASGKELFGAFDIGINPNVKSSKKGKFRSWVAEGTVSIGFGNNMWAGGSNTVAWGTYGNIPGCTVTIDGNVIVDKGKLKLTAKK